MVMEELIERLRHARIGATFNFYRDGDGAAARRQRLRAYLEARADAPLLLVGEAAGYRGARVSGIPFTSERQLTGAGPAEATATIVRRTLAELGLEEEALCWNVVPTHPHRPSRPDTNRPPTRAEIDGGRGRFCTSWREAARCVAVGRVAQAALDAPYVRHPSHGGAAEFRAGLLRFRRRRTLSPPLSMQKTWNAKPGEVERRWYVVDAEGKTLGRLATQIADTLRGKGKPQYTPHVDTGDFVVVVNAEKIHVTGNKLDEKMYHRHSGYPGGLKSRPLRDELERRPTEVLRKAVKGMLPRNRLARAQLSKLKIYAGPEHPHEAQAPSELKVEA